MAEEERLQLEEEKMMAEDNMKRQEAAKRLRLEEENMLKMEEVKKNSRKAFMNSERYQRYVPRLPPSKRRNYLEPDSESENAEKVIVSIKKHGPDVNNPRTAELLTRVQPWVEVLP